MQLFFQRFILSIIQCSYLFQAEIIFSALGTSILFWGIRFMFLFTPTLQKIFRQQTFIIVLIFIPIGSLIAWNRYPIIGLSMISLGLSVSNFMVKKASAKYVKKSAWNKIAVNLGSLLVGTIFYFYPKNGNDILQLLPYLTFFVIILSVIDRNNSDEKEIEKIETIKHLNLTNVFWLLVGVILGFRIFGAYIVMSKYLSNASALDKHGTLLFTYSILVICTQIPSTLKKYRISLNYSISALVFSVFVLVFTYFFGIETFLGGIIWISLLAAEELFSPYIDQYSNQDKSLFFKEMGVAIGGAIIPFLIRGEEEVSFQFLFATAFISLVVWALRQRLK